jgi:hypothetical protein
MMASKAILFQSIVNPTTSAPIQQLSDLQLTGVVTIDQYANHDSGKLYGTFSYSSPSYSFQLFMDSARTNLVASATATSAGLATITQANNSGLSGTINIIPGTVTNDILIEAIVSFTTDDNIPLDNLNVTSDFDPVYGFSTLHVQAFEFVKNYIRGRFESVLWNENLISYGSINSGTGGFDLSRILSWMNPDIVEAASQYVLHLITRKQDVHGDGVFAKRSKCAYERCVALLEAVQIAFDENLTRVPRKTRATSIFKITRA